MERTIGHAARNRGWLVAMLFGTVGAAAVWLLAPQGREVASSPEFVSKLVVFACIVLATALFPNQRRGAGTPSSRVTDRRHRHGRG